MTLIPRPTDPSIAPEVVDIGEDGMKQVTYGHLEPVTFACMVVAHQAKVAGLNEGACSMLLGWSTSPVDDVAALADIVRHVWAVERTAPDEIDPEDSDLPFDSSVEPGGPYVMWDGVKESDEGAFPVTVLDLEA